MTWRVLSVRSSHQTWCFVCVQGSWTLTSIRRWRPLNTSSSSTSLACTWTTCLRQYSEVRAVEWRSLLFFFYKVQWARTLRLFFFFLIHFSRKFSRHHLHYVSLKKNEKGGGGGCFSCSGCFDRFIRQLEWKDKSNKVGLILHVSGSQSTVGLHLTKQRWDYFQFFFTEEKKIS